MNNDICVGDKFYFNSYCVQRGFSIPDYLEVSEISKDGEFITGQYVNHAVDTRPRLFAKRNLLFDSNLNPKRENPGWIFTKVKEETQNGQINETSG